jgi:PPOX class probable F420-dependent enzyme
VEPALAARLAEADVLWVTTIGDGGQPQTSPVWFLWHDGAFHLASEPDATKVANIRSCLLISVHLEGAGSGDLVVTVEGSATIDAGFDEVVAARYVDKYRIGIAGLGLTPPAYLSRFAAGVTISPSRWRVFPSG